MGKLIIYNKITINNHHANIDILTLKFCIKKFHIF